MTQFVSAGVYTVEKDLSAYITDLSSTIVGMVGTAEKGPTNTPILITSQKEYVDIFGNLNPKHYMGYAALAYLKKGNLLWVNRVSAPDSKKALASFFLPEGYQQFAGNWVLTNASTSDLTFELSDFVTATGKNKVIKLDADTVIPGFNPMDTTQQLAANDLLGSDFTTFVDHKSLATGNYVSVTLGAGKGVNTIIKDVVDGTHGPAIKVPLASFPTTNSPANAYAVGAIAMSQPVSWVAPSEGTTLMVLGTSDDAIPVELTYISTGFATDQLKATLLSNLTSSVKATKFAALETLVTATAASKYEIAIPLYDPHVAGNPAKNLALLKAILDAVLAVVNETVAPVVGTYPNLNVAYAHLRADVTTDLKGVGSILSGASRGFKSVTSVYDANGAVIAVQLEALVAGVLGTFKYSAQTPAPVSPFVVQDQVISGSLSTGLYRPIWKMVPAGTSSYVPTIIKISSIGEADASNVVVTLGIDVANVTADKTQNYSLKVFERLSAITVSSTSMKQTDFVLVEQYDGTIENIHSNVAQSSRRISMKIDYSTADFLDMTTGTVTMSSVASDSLVFIPALVGVLSDYVVTEGYSFASNVSAFDKVFTIGLQNGSIGSLITSNEIIGASADSTGVYAFANPETLDINVLVAPGWSADPAIAKAMASICETRGDAIAILDTPFGLNVQNVVNYRKNINGINSSYAALYYPWVKITDTVNKKYIFVPPSGQVVGQYAYNDQVADVYYAPAGRTRGTLTDAITTERVLNQGDRDMLALNQINPIHNEASYGVYIKGQYTLQTNTTALDRVNVRRLLLKLRKVVATASKAFEFEPGDSTTAYRLKQVAETVLEDHLKKGAINSYTVDVGSNVNTLLVRENNELRMEITIIPTKTAEKIVEIFSVLPQSGGVSLG